MKTNKSEKLIFVTNDKIEAYKEKTVHYRQLFNSNLIIQNEKRTGLVEGNFCSLLIVCNIFNCLFFILLFDALVHFHQPTKSFF